MTQPSGTVTLLTADIEDSTRLLQQLGERWDDVIADYEAILDGAAEAHDGHVVDRQGDSALVAFSRARDAVLAAVDVQRGLRDGNWPEGVALRAGIALHTDEPRVRPDGRYSGLAVHRAVRLASLARGGQVLLSGSTRVLVDGELPDDLSLRDLGSRTLRGIERPEQVSQLVIDGVEDVTATDRDERDVRSTLPGGTVTFLFSDIEGSTRLTRELGEGWRPVLADHRRLLREAFTERDGREVDMQGDAFFFAFGRARDAVDAAVAAQRALAAHDWPGGVEVRVRMGIHTGEPSLGEEGYLGLDVVRAARLCATAHGGQVLVSATTRALLGPEAPAGVELRDLGEHPLKDLEYREHVFQVVAPDLPTDFGPLRTAAAATPAPFAGRERELASEARVVADDLGKRIEEHVAQTVRSKQQEVLERLRERGIVGPDALDLGVPRDVQKRAITGRLVLAGFIFLVLAATVALLYLFFG
jgi:class 3 adenylate cyclase